MYILFDCNSIPPVITGLLHQLYLVLMVIIPAGIVLFGTIDFLKAVMAKDDKATSANTSLFIKRLISGVAALFVLVLVKWLFSIIGNVNGASEAFACANAILNGQTNGSTYQDGSNETNISNYQQCLNSCESKTGGNATAYNECIKSMCSNYNSTTTTTVTTTHTNSNNNPFGGTGGNF